MFTYLKFEETTQSSEFSSLEFDRFRLYQDCILLCRHDRTSQARYMLQKSGYALLFSKCYETYIYCITQIHVNAKCFYS